ncbi:MAG: hypothetical protein HDR03_04240 [Lachnospiraceae bacterium]|nr:hypothetical protein [Lachnospiraceae bacterium]
MKKILTIILTAVTICIGAAATKLPAFANSNIDINSTGCLTLEGGDVLFDSKDIEDINTQVKTLSEDFSEGNYVSSKEGTLKNVFNSKGIINYDSGKVIFDSSDLIKLANGIDNLKTCYQSEVVKSLNSIHTYYKPDGTVTHIESDAISSDEASNLTFAQICNGILKSQSLEHLAGENIMPASADNLSEGSAAWVDGDIVIGTGNDNKASYEQGYEKGYEDGEAANSGGKCYYLGNIRTISQGQFCCDVKTKVPDIDYTKLTRNNFIICPSIINANTETASSSASGSGKPYCTIPEQELKLRSIAYDKENGILYFSALQISANGGLNSGSTKTVETNVTVSIYLYTGDIIQP